MRKPCPNEILLSALMDGELSRDEAAAVRRHLDHCDTCRNQLAALTATDSMIQGMASIEPSPDFERLFWQKVARWEARRERRWWTRFWQPVWRPALAVCLTAGLVVAAIYAIGPDRQVSPADRFMADNIDFLNDYDVIQDLEILENWDALEAMKELS